VLVGGNVGPLHLHCLPPALLPSYQYHPPGEAAHIMVVHGERGSLSRHATVDLPAAHC
jgi:hypothetical protein